MKQGDEQWHQERDLCAVTCSELGTALGVGYRSRQKFMREKLGIDEVEAGNWRMEEGNKREPFVALTYQHLMNEVYGRKVQLRTHAFQRHATLAAFGGSPDRIVQEGDKEYLLEIKTCPDGVGRDYIPVTHLLQMLGLCKVYNLPYSHYICSTYNDMILMAEVHFDPHLWPQIVEPRVRDWIALWQEGRIPDRMKKGEKEALVETICNNCDVRVIEEHSDRRQRLRLL